MNLRRTWVEEEVSKALGGDQFSVVSYGEGCSRKGAAADSFAQALGNYRDIVGQVVTPDDLSSLDDTDPAG